MFDTDKKGNQLPKKVGGYRMKLQYFAEGGEGGGQNPEGGQRDQQPTDEQGTEQGSNQQQQQQNTFTQEDVNNIVAKEAKKAQEKLLKQLGIEDFNSAKEGLQKFKEWQESQKTEAEKQAERLQKLETDYQTVTSENETLKAQLSAMKAGVNPDSVEDVVTLAKNLVSDEVDMDQAIQKVLEKYPHFKAQQEPQQEQKPTFTTGQHTKQPQSELDKWLNAFKN
ncbi:hypothetical protein CathTA2_2461 [Caldalkalibacillus thermarum TA2.A1]|uniref:Phage protein n=1 Tax=Caldalkalibacillus thermarum (strain TA2.A1) TaxID=986075 RepID=F5L9F6_CALTT|nr:hypothetical protein [Caldalkalibacillus thermarum]EGL82098.1 hypothetical protein CathTA2_2461 [Caldalkalibacillus thermarum TA2.A1]QZT33993.1 hypothetical protein HUR95_00695 [Caldalkalibacillus thermarum TA2.A1]